MSSSFAEQVSTDPGANTREIFGTDTPENRQRYYRLFRLPEGKRPAGLFEFAGKKALHVEVFREAARQRALGIHQQ
jgi:hypothetical protein